MAFSISKYKYYFCLVFATAALLFTGKQVALAAEYGQGTYGTGSYNVGAATTDVVSGTSQTVVGDAHADGVCLDQPTSQRLPWLYGAIAESSGQITLYFTPADEPVSAYVLQYGTTSGSYQFGVQDMLVNTREQMKFKVQSLRPSTTYYFRVRAQNGCQTGEWSNEIASTTTGWWQRPQVVIAHNVLTTAEPTADADSSTTDTVEALTKLGSLLLTVLDQTGQPLQAVQVRIDGQVLGQTDERGEFSVNEIVDGAKQISLSSELGSAEQTFYLQAGQQATLTMTIAPPSSRWWNRHYLWVLGLGVGLAVAAVVWGGRKYRG